MPQQPLHPGKILKEEYFEPRGISITEAAKLIGVTRQALNNIVNEKSGVSPEMAVSLGRLLHLRPEKIQEWQKDYELERARSVRASRNRGRSDSYLIKSSDLIAWAEKTDARYTLPQLVRMMVRASCGAGATVVFPTAEDSQHPGWDGRVENFTRVPFVPLGTSGWELSTESNPQSKAESDYKNRTTNPDGLDPKTTIFVAASARKWKQKRQWAAAKRVEKFWADVVAYDAVDFENWLESCPEVGIWFTTFIGRRPRGVQSLESFWNEFRLSTSPPITPSLLVAGRNSEAKKVRQWLETGSGVFRVVGDSSDEALAFAAAVSITAEDQVGLGPVTVVTDVEQARQLLSVEHQLTIAWRLDDTSMLGALVDEGHRAILPLGRSSSLVGSPDIELPRLRRAEFVSAIKEALSSDFNESHGPAWQQDEDRRAQAARWEEEASRRARKCGRSITVYRRLFASAGAARLPAWASIEKADELIPVVLAGSWSEDNDADRQAIAKLAGCEYEAISRTVTRWRSETDAPVRRIGETWRLTAPLDSWSRMVGYISESDLERYRKTVLEVLGESDPKLDLAPDERWLADLHRKRFKYSKTLREGLAESLILLAVVWEEAQRATLPVAYRLSHQIVTELLGNKANSKRWASLSDVLPELAEACPGAFLAALEDDLADESSDVKSLFVSEGAPLRESARYPQLLWALEILSWYPEYLPQAAIALAKLERFAMATKIVNRPRKSLSEIFCTWHDNTAASLEERLQTIDLLLRDESEIGWQLLLTLLPKLHDVSGDAAEPRWRPKPETDPLTNAEKWRARDEVIRRAIDSAANDGTRLTALLSEIALWSPEQRRILMRQMEAFSVACGDIAERTRFWNALREFIARHRAFPKAAWSVNEAELFGFEQLLARFEPSDRWERSLWLFDRDLPEVANSSSYSAAERDAAEKRADVAKEIYQEQGTDGLARFAQRVKMPWLVGIAAAEAVAEPEIDEQILDRFLAHREKSARDCALAFAMRRRELNGSQWSDKILKSYSFDNWAADKKAEFCLCLPAGAETWGLVSGLGSEVDGQYWSKTHVSIIRFDNNESETAVGKLIHFGHGLRALEQAGFQPEKLTPNTLIKVLEAAFIGLANADDLSHATMLQYYLERIFQKLRTSGEVPDVILGKLEWQYLPLLRFTSNPATLHRFLQQDPEFFATVVEYAYEPDNKPDEQPTARNIPEDQRRNRARTAWDLLNSWHTPPGLEPNQKFDPIILKDWVVKARSLCLARGRSTWGDDRIGHLLAWVPNDPDGAWPHAAVRDLIEEAKSSALEAGIHAGRFNSRGVYTKDPLEGGRGQREHAKQYRTWAKRATRWPRTRKLLDSLADIYERFGRTDDVLAEQLDLD